MTTFWQRVDTLLVQGQNLKWLAEETGIKYKTLTGCRHKGRLPALDDGVKIAQALGVSVEFLLTGTEPYVETDEEPARVAVPGLEAEIKKIVLEVLREKGLG